MFALALFLHLLPLSLLATCPPDTPIPCLKYNVCCDYDQFCYNGMCESCLPHLIQGHEKQLNWCRHLGVHNVSLMRDPSCRVACQAKFTIHELAVHSKMKEEKQIKYGPGEDKRTDNVWFHLFLAVSVACCVFLILLVAVAFLSLMMYRSIILHHRRDRFGALVRNTKRHRRQNDGEEAENRYISLEQVSPPEVPPPRVISFANGKHQPRLVSEVKNNLENECEALSVQNQNSS